MHNRNIDVLIFRFLKEDSEKPHTNRNEHLTQGLHLSLLIGRLAEQKLTELSTSIHGATSDTRF